MNSEVRITIGDITFNDFSDRTRFYKVENVPEMLSTLATERTETSLQGDHGVTDSLSFYGPRILPFAGEIIAPTQAERITMERELQQTLALAALQSYDTIDGYILVEFVLEDATAVQCYAKILQPPTFNRRSDLALRKRARTFSFVMIAKDPRLYGQTLEEEEGEETFQGTNMQVIEGESPTAPYQLYELTSVSVTCDNEGTFDAPPVITIHGPTTSPVLTNVTTDKYISLDGLTLDEGESVTIDVIGKTITQDDGTNLSAYFASGSSWLVLVPGENEFTLLDDSPYSVEADVTIQWRPAYI